MKAEDEVKMEESIEEQTEEEEEPITPAKEPESAKKRRVKRIVFYVCALTVALIVCSMLSLTVFFKIDEIYVEGSTIYSAEEIIAESMIKKNDNLILCNTSPGEKNIVEKFPYVEKADIQKKLFNKIAIKITEAKPTSMIKSGDRYYILSKSGKIIEIDTEKKYDVPTIVGAKLKNTKLCDYAEYENKNVKKYVEDIISLIKKYEIKGISTIDVTSLTNISLTRQNGFKLIIGSPENLDYKFNSASSIMNENVSDNDVGVLDVSVVDENGARSFFKTKETSKQQSSKPEEKSKEESSKTESSLIEQSSEEVSQESENTEIEESTEISENEYEEESSEDEYEEEYSENEYEEESSEDEYEEEYSEYEYEEESSEDEYEEEYSEYEYEEESSEYEYEEEYSEYEYEENENQDGDNEE